VRQHFRWAEDSGLSVIGSNPIRAPSASVAKWYSNSHVVPCPSSRTATSMWRQITTSTLNHGGRMAHPANQHDFSFEITSKRRKGFPSETHVKRGVQIVHGSKELSEKLGRNDPCPCGSGRSF
jgi:hypothetical protein